MNLYPKTNLLLLLVVTFIPAACLAQGAGFGAGGAGAAANAYQNQPASVWSPNGANYSELIAISGTAEIAVKPESLRLVLAVTSEAPTARECSQAIGAVIANIRNGIGKFGLQERDVVEDFIVVVQQYQWELDKFGKREVVREKPDGFRMQTNLHILCKDEAQALKAIDVAFGEGVSEIVSFDYWHSNLDQVKQDAMKKALAAAKAKSEILLAIFDEKPKILNINSSISLSSPATQYKTLTPRPSDSFILAYDWQKIPRIKAHRPLTTFYAGGQAFSDVTPDHPPMRPEILVQATIKLTYESPVRQERMEIERMKAMQKDVD